MEIQQKKKRSSTENVRRDHSKLAQIKTEI